MMQAKQKGTVFFDTQPHGAKVYVDGQLLTDPDTEESLHTPVRVLLLEGRIDYTLVLEDYNDISGYIDIYPSATVNIFRNFSQGKSEEGWGKPTPQIWLDQNVGTIRVYSEPKGAEIYIDENPVIDQSGNIAKTPVTITGIPDGIRQVTLVIPGHFDEMKFVDVYPGEESNIITTMRPYHTK